MLQKEKGEEHPTDLQEKEDGLFNNHDKLYVPCSLMGKTLKKCHDNNLSSHFGFVKSAILVARGPKIGGWVCQCLSYLLDEQTMVRGNLLTIATLRNAHQTLITDIPPSKGKTMILLVGDEFLKQAHGKHANNTHSQKASHPLHKTCGKITFIS